MMAKQPEQRYPDAATVLEDVRKLIRVLKESGRLEQVKLADIGVEAEAHKTFTGRHPVISLVLLCLVAAGASAGVGRWMRPGDPLLAPARADDLAGAPKLGSAREQFLSAMLRVNNEEAFRAAAGWLDAYANSLYRSVKNARDGHPLAAHPPRPGSRQAGG